MYTSTSVAWYPSDGPSDGPSERRDGLWAWHMAAFHRNPTMESQTKTPHEPGFLIECKPSDWLADRLIIASYAVAYIRPGKKKNEKKMVEKEKNVFAHFLQRKPSPLANPQGRSRLRSDHWGKYGRNNPASNWCRPCSALSYMVPPPIWCPLLYGAPFEALSSRHTFCNCFYSSFSSCLFVCLRLKLAIRESPPMFTVLLYQPFFSKQGWIHGWTVACDWAGAVLPDRLTDRPTHRRKKVIEARARD